MWKSKAAEAGSVAFRSNSRTLRARQKQMFRSLKISSAFSYSIRLADHTPKRAVEPTRVMTTAA
jgi:hypothetical protein